MSTRSTLPAIFLARYQTGPVVKVITTRPRTTRDRFDKCPKRAIGALVISAMLALSACSSDNAAVSPTKSTNPTFTLSEFTIKLSQTTFPSGRVTLTATNVGGEEHELVIVKASAVADLPTNADGSVDEEKIPEADKMGEIEHVAANQSKSADFELVAGTYVAFCNLIDKMGAGSMNAGGMTDTSNGGPTGSMMGGANGSPMAAGGGHVHFARGMYLPFDVE